MAVTIQTVSRGTIPGDGTGDTAYDGTGKINTNFSNLKAAADLVLDVPTANFIGRVAGTTGDAQQITATEATSLLNVFTPTLKGLVPLSGGGTTNFLRADGTFAEPAGVTDHTQLSNIGTNTHAQIDTHIGLTNEHIDWTSATASISTTGSIAGSNVSGTNTGDQTSIVGISGTKAEFNTAVTDGTILYVGDVTSDTGVPAITSNGTTPSLNTGITGAEVRTLIGAGTSSTVGTVTSVSGTGTVSGLTLSGTVTDSGNITLGGAITGFATGTGSATGTNTGDQTSIVGITGTLAQFNTALTDATFATGGGTATGTNTGDNAVNSLYSGLVSDTGVPAILSNGTTPSLNTGITGAEVRSLIGAGTSSTTGTVTAVNNGNGMNFTNFTTSGTVTLGTPSTCTAATSNAVQTSSHTHAITGFATGTGTASGTNTGDQTSIVGISGTKAQFNTACTDGTFLFSGDVTSDTGTPAILSNGSTPSLNTGITGAEVRTLIGAGTSSTVGTVTSVGTNAGLSGTVTSSGNLSLNLAGVTTVTTALVSTDHVVCVDGTANCKVTLANFANEMGAIGGWTTNTGTVTSVAGGTGVTSTGGTTPSLSLDFTELSTVTTALTSSDYIIALDGTLECKVTLANLANELEAIGGWVTTAGYPQYSTSYQSGYSSTACIDYNATTMNVNFGGLNDFRFTDGGAFEANGNITAYSGNISSDRNLKKNIKPISDALKKVKTLTGCEFEWKRDDKTGGGLIAQDVQEVMPNAVHEHKNLHTEETYLTLDYNHVIGLLVQAINELADEVYA